jgi:thiol-disulfide isomerase/thioredoxin
MILQKIYIVALLLLSCTGSTDDIERNKNIKVRTNQVILIFEDPPVNNHYRLNERVTLKNQGNHEIEYVDDHLIVQYLPFDYVSESDTIIIDTQRDILEVQHAYRGSDKLSYLFHNGDSALFSYKEGKPIVTVTNRKTLYHDLNYEIQKREDLYQEEFPASVKYYSFLSFYDINYKNLVTDTRRILKKLRKEAEKERNREIKFLDSLRQNNLISSKVFEFYKIKSWYEVEKMLPMVTIDKKKRRDDDILKYSDWRKLITKANDSLRFYGFYQDFLHKMVVNYYESGVNRIISSNANLPNYRQVYDSIATNNLLGEYSKKILLLAYIRNIVETSSVDTISSYLDKFKKDGGDTVLTNYITLTYNLDFDKNDELLLKTFASNEVSLSDLLTANRGKVVYIDFWASWCAPCIRAMPASKELQKAYADKGLTFLYFSIDEDVEKWQKAALKQGIDGDLNSYLVYNQHTSKTLEELSIESIPRYLLYDQHGNLVHRNAPGPGSEEIKKLLDQYLIDS